MLVQCRHLAIGPDRRGQRALEAPLKVDLKAATGNRARCLDQALMGRAESIAFRWAKLKRRRAGRRLSDEASRLGIDKGPHTRRILGNICPAMRRRRSAVFGRGWEYRRDDTQDGKQRRVSVIFHWRPSL